MGCTLVNPFLVDAICIAAILIRPHL